MSIIASDLSYRYLHRQLLFTSVSFSVPTGGKASLIGNNGVGKSTLLKLLAGELSPASGSIRSASTPYYIPQQIGLQYQTIAELLGVSKKLEALQAICDGSSDAVHYDTLNDDWDIENRCQTALKHWELQNKTLNTPTSSLSGGEKTKVLLAGLTLHGPEVVLLDEPTNHLDLRTREKLYEYVAHTPATIVVVSHDVTLLNLLNSTYELSSGGIRIYGGNYDFYREQKGVEERALTQQIDAERSTLRSARVKAREVRERQERRASQGERNQAKAGVARIVLNARAGLSENSSAKLKEKHAGLIDESQRRLAALRERQRSQNELKIDFEDAELHDGKRLISACGVNFRFGEEAFLWSSGIDLEIRSGDRVRLLGNNGSGKTTLLKLLLGELQPTQGEVIASDFSHVYLDQEYEPVNRPCTVLELAEQYNTHQLADHEIKLRLHRALFPPDAWDKNCRTLSGGERMRLYLCCLMISNHIPDVFVLDEPTNNLDLASLEILIDTLKNYRGTVLVISHDDYFIRQIGISKNLEL